MKTSHKMFLRRDGKRGHEAVLVVIDWNNVSDEDMKLMACHYIVNCAARDLKGWDTQLPQSIEYQASEFVHNEPLVKMPQAPESWKTSSDKPKNDLEKALAGLSKEELFILLNEFA